MAEVAIVDFGLTRLDNSASPFSTTQWGFVTVLDNGLSGSREQLFGHLLIGGAQSNNPNQFYVMKVTALWGSPSLTVIANLFGSNVLPSDFEDDLWYMAFKPRMTGITLDVYGVR